MSATKRDSPDGCGTREEEFWRGYEEWSDDLSPTTEEDVNQMFAEYQAQQFECDGLNCPPGAHDHKVL